MDAAVVIVEWLVMGLVLFGLVGEFVIEPMRRRSQRTKKPNAKGTNRK